MVLKIGNDNISNIYIGDIEVSKVYLGEVLVKGGGSNNTSSTWTLTRKTNGEVMAEFEFSEEELPENISYNGVVYYQISALNSNGESYTLHTLENNRVVDETIVEANSAYSPTDYNNEAIWMFSLPSPYHIEVNCTPM